MTNGTKQSSRKGAPAARRGTPSAWSGEAPAAELSREINRDTVLELIRKRQPIARVELARESGLQNSTVSSIAEQLLREGWIQEVEAERTARGRPPMLLSLTDRSALLVADTHVGKAHVAAVDLNGRILYKSTVTLATDAKKGVAELSAALRDMRGQIAGRRVEGVGICLPGRVDSEHGNLVLAPNLQWLDFPVRSTLEKSLGEHVEIENDANACLLSELWFGNREGLRNAVLLSIAEGVGAAILANGKLVYGSLGLAGEVGHICYDPDGPKCACGRTGCWEMFASTGAVLRTYAALKPTAPARDFAEICQMAHDGDSAARQAIERQAVAIGRGLRIVTASLAPEVILFAGEIAACWDIAEPLIQRECQNGLLGGDGPQIICLKSGESANLLGAAAVVLQRHSGYYRSRSLMES